MDIADIAVIAYRFGDTFLFIGRATCISDRVVVASVVGDLFTGEIVALRYPANASEPTQRYSRVQQRQGNQYEFLILSLDEQQLRHLKQTGDGLLAAQLWYLRRRRSTASVVPPSSIPPFLPLSGVPATPTH